MAEFGILGPATLTVMRDKIQFITISMKYVSKDTFVYWGALAVLVLFIYYQFSSGQFSFIFTLAGTVQTFGFALIVLKIRKSRSVTGLSR